VFDTLNEEIMYKKHHIFLNKMLFPKLMVA